MTPAEEDCIVNDYHPSIEGNPHYPVAEAIRLAIRAAVAAERERAARVCLSMRELSEKWGEIPAPPEVYAEAIRRG